jgi:hypothetical protein
MKSQSKTDKGKQTAVVPGMLSAERYIQVLEASNRTLNAENRRLVNMLLSILDKREREADQCAKCSLKK